MWNLRIKTTFFILSFLIVLPAVSQAEVYEWIDSDGVRHFATEPPHEDAIPTELPPIMHEQSLRARPSSPETCTSHGGINCNAGPDTDGSVICFDGFSEVVTSYRYHCFAARLVVSEVSEIDEKGQVHVYVRNERPVPARRPTVEFSRETGERLEASGPDEIPGHGLEEFVLDGLLPQIDSVETASLSVSCENC